MGPENADCQHVYDDDLLIGQQSRPGDLCRNCLEPKPDPELAPPPAPSPCTGPAANPTEGGPASGEHGASRGGPS